MQFGGLDSNVNEESENHSGAEWQMKNRRKQENMQGRRIGGLGRLLEKSSMP